MLSQLILMNFISELSSVATEAIEWAIKVSIFVTAILMAISLLSWLVHRS